MDGTFANVVFDVPPFDNRLVVLGRFVALGAGRRLLVAADFGCNLVLFWTKDTVGVGFVVF